MKILLRNNYDNRDNCINTLSYDKKKLMAKHLNIGINIELWQYLLWQHGKGTRDKRQLFVSTFVFLKMPIRYVNL